MRASLALLCVLAAGFAEATVPQPSSAPSGESAALRAVQVEAVVTDRRGGRVRGLTAADFRVLVDGKEVPVEGFAEVPEPAGRNFLVFLDESFAIDTYRDEVLRNLESQLSLLGPGDRMAFVAFDGQKLEMLSDWLDDRDALRLVIAQAKVRSTGGDSILTWRRSLARNPQPVQRIQMGVGNAVETSPYPSQSDDGNVRMRALLLPEMTKAIAATAAAMRTVPAPPGRKVMLLLSGGWPFPEPWMIADDPFRATPAGYSSTDPRELFVPIVETANLLGYTLYPVEVHGSDPNVFSSDIKRITPAAHSNNSLSITGWEVGVQDALMHLARETGGQALLDDDRLQVLKRADADTRSYYRFELAPAWRGDGKRHKIEVEPRRRGLNARSRSGFADLSEKAEAARKAESLLLWEK